MIMTMKDWEQQLLLDRNRLDDAALNQPQLYWEVSEAYVLAVSERDSLDAKLKQVKAERSLAIRSEAVAAGEKLTEAAVAAKLEMDPDILKATREYLDQCTDASLLQVMKESFSQRAYMIQELGNQFRSNYFQKSAVTGGAAGEVAYNKTRQAINEKRKAGGRK